MFIHVFRVKKLPELVLAEVSLRDFFLFCLGFTKSEINQANFEERGVFFQKLIFWAVKIGQNENLDYLR